MSIVLKDRIIGQLDSLNDVQLRKVAGAVDAAKRGHGATFGELLTEFGGSIPDAELDRMEAAIERDCERIDSD